MATVNGTWTVDIEAPASECWGLLLDAEAYPTWYDTLDEVVVEKRDGEGRPGLIAVRSEVGAPLGAIVFALELSYDPVSRVVGRQVGSGSFVKDVSSEWHLTAVGPDRTRATYSMSITGDGMRANLAFKAAQALVRRDLIEGFPRALKAQAERARAG